MWKCLFSDVDAAGVCVDEFYAIENGNIQARTNWSGGIRVSALCFLNSRDQDFVFEFTSSADNSSVYGEESQRRNHINMRVAFKLTSTIGVSLSNSVYLDLWFMTLSKHEISLHSSGNISSYVVIYVGMNIFAYMFYRHNKLIEMESTSYQSRLGTPP